MFWFGSVVVTTKIGLSSLRGCWWKGWSIFSDGVSCLVLGTLTHPGLVWASLSTPYVGIHVDSFHYLAFYFDLSTRVGSEVVRLISL